MLRWAVLVALLPACALHESDETCADDIDNDGDGRIDCADTDCLLAPACLRCGDGILDDTEACDDGNRKDGDGCDNRCQLESCGNGNIDPGETCDDGNLISGDGCSFRCKLDLCGDGIVEAGEDCDDHNTLSGDGCSSFCTLETPDGALCGNGNVDFNSGEQCDDFNRRDGDGCNHLCQNEFCGDGVRQPLRGELCDGEPGCVGCTPQSACVGALCFDVSRDAPFGPAACVAVTHGAVTHAFLSSLQLQLFRYDIVGGRLVNGQFPSFAPVLTALAAVDFDGDGVDALFGGDSAGDVGELQLDTGQLTTRALLTDRILDVTVGDAAPAAGLEVVFVARNATYAVLDATRAIARGTLSQFASRVITAPLEGGAGVVLGGELTTLVPAVVAGGVLVEGAAVEVGDVVQDLARADVDGDGVDDVVVLTRAPDALLAFSVVGGTLTNLRTLADAAGADALTAADIDGDGADDLVTVGGGAVRFHLAADGFVAAPTGLPAPLATTRATTVDVDGDGDLDLFLASRDFNTNALLFVQR